MKPACRSIISLLAICLFITLCVSNAFANSVLELPSSVYIIEEEAFYGDTSIDKVILPDNVSEIRSKAFANSSLNEINLPESLTFIADNAFEGTNDVNITASKGTYPYEWAVRLGYIDEDNHSGILDNGIQWSISDGKLIISGTGAMPDFDAPWNEYAELITAIEVQEGITHIGDGAFLADYGPGMYCFEQAISISLPHSLRTIGDYVFGSLMKSELIIPDGVTAIGERLCLMAERVILPASVQSIGEEFMDNNILGNGNDGTTVVCPAGSYAQHYIESLEDDRITLILESDSSPIEDFSFLDNGDGTCTITTYTGEDASIIIPATNADGLIVTIIGSGSFSNNCHVESVELPDSILRIESSAFANSSVNWIYLPESIIYIAEDAFEGCDNIFGNGFVDTYAYDYFSEHELEGSWESNTFGFTIDGFWFEAESVDAESCIVVGYDGSDENIIIPSKANYGGSKNVIGIGHNDVNTNYLWNSNVKTITIPSTVTYIGDWVFDECVNLKSIYIPSSVRSIGIFTDYRHNDDLVIYGEKDSYAETFANENNMPFAIGDIPDEPIEYAIPTITSVSFVTDSMIVGNRSIMRTCQ